MRYTDLTIILLITPVVLVQVDQKEDEDHCVSGLGNPVGTEEAGDIDDENEQGVLPHRTQSSVQQLAQSPSSQPGPSKAQHYKTSPGFPPSRISIKVTEG